MSGKLTMIVGPMFSAKSAVLINMHNQLVQQGQRLFCVKPKRDTRDKAAVISRKGAELPARMMRYGPMTHADLSKIDTIVFDEIHMFDQGVVGRIHLYLKDLKKDVICAGLDLDWRTRPFVLTSLLLAHAHVVVRTLATCDTCGADAIYTQRTVASDSLILAGDRDIYQAACRLCYQPPSCLEFVSDKKVTINATPLAQ